MPSGFYRMDCMDGMAQFPDGFFDLAIVDPPYGIKIKGGFGRRKNDLIATKYDKNVCWDSTIPDEQYFNELMRVSKNQIVWGGNYYVKYLYATNSWIIWDKKYNTDQLTFSMAELAWTSFNKPIKIFYKTNNESWSKKIHPTEKPVALYSWILERYAKPGYKILDTHVGSASSLIACHRKGLEYWGFEIDETYYAMAKQRLDKELAQVTLTEVMDAHNEQTTMWEG